MFDVYFKANPTLSILSNNFCHRFTLYQQSYKCNIRQFSSILYSLKIVITHMKLLVAVMHLQFIRLPFIDIDIDALQ